MVVIEFPLRGEWKAINSPGHHRFAFDFAVVQNGRLHNKGFLQHLLGRLSVEDSYSWTRPVYTPFGGLVLAARDGWTDRLRLSLVADAFRVFLARQPLDPNDLRPATGNYVIIQSDAGSALLAHLHQGSIQVSPGQQVRAGQLIAEVGNSGRSLMPHLHLQIMDGANPLTAKMMPFAVHAFERWTGTGWQTVQNDVLRKGETIRFKG